MSCFIVNASAFLLAAAVSVATFGGNAVLARHQFVVAEHGAVGSGHPRDDNAACNSCLFESPPGTSSRSRTPTAPGA